MVIINVLMRRGVQPVGVAQAVHYDKLMVTGMMPVLKLARGFIWQDDFSLELIDGTPELHIQRSIGRGGLLRQEMKLLGKLNCPRRNMM